jgi:hypothetical protein
LHDTFAIPSVIWRSDFGLSAGAGSFGEKTAIAASNVSLRNVVMTA